ncbi:MAG: hypothetical protein WC933_01270 [Candidatus Paceibacterota bacterium]|jgi:hypothetical protein
MRTLIFLAVLVLSSFCFVSKNSQYGVFDAKEVIINNTDDIKFTVLVDNEKYLINLSLGIFNDFVYLAEVFAGKSFKKSAVNCNIDLRPP